MAVVLILTFNTEKKLTRVSRSAHRPIKSDNCKL